MTTISEKQLRGVRRELFHIMDEVTINLSLDVGVTKFGKKDIMELSLKVVGLSYDDVLTKQLWAEYKTWQYTKDGTSE